MNATLLFSIATLALATLAHAGPLDWLRPDALTADKIAEAKAELHLSSEQEPKFDAALAAGRQKAEPLESTLREQQQAFEHQLRDPSTTADAASAALTKMLEAEAALKQNQLRTILALRDVLTPEQQKLVAKKSSGHAGKDGSALHATAARLRAAVDALGIPLTEGMKERGEQIEYLMKEGKTTEAEAAMNKLVADSGIDQPESTETPDFSKSEPGDTDLGALQDRFKVIEAKAQNVVSLPLMRKLLKAKDAFEQAKAAQDAVAVGRVLTWIESEMAKQTRAQP